MIWPDWAEQTRDFKRVAVISDLHSGHRVGLTPPGWWGGAAHDKWEALRMNLWKYYAEKIDSIKPIDILVVNGDAIDGRGERSGSTELITADRHEQGRIAAAAINYADPDKVLMTRGTPYHTGQAEDFEDFVAGETNAVTIKDQLWIEVNGVVFDFMHTIGGSTVPYGRATAIAKDRFWNLVWNDFYASQPKADVVVRSHVHYTTAIIEPTWAGFITPALQGLGSKFGSRICKGIVHFGFIYFDVYTREKWLEMPTWGRFYLTGKEQKKTALIL